MLINNKQVVPVKVINNLIFNWCLPQHYTFGSETNWTVVHMYIKRWSRYHTLLVLCNNSNLLPRYRLSTSTKKPSTEVTLYTCNFSDLSYKPRVNNVRTLHRISHSYDTNGWQRNSGHKFWCVIKLLNWIILATYNQLLEENIWSNSEINFDPEILIRICMVALIT